MAKFDCSAWFIGKSLSTDWASSNFANSLLAGRRDRALKILEIGSWEGRSAIFFLRYFPHATLTTIDTFAGSPEIAADNQLADLIPGVEERFDSNVAEFGSRIEKIKATSHAALAGLATEFRRFDLIYIDGSHHSADVYADAAMSWPMLTRGGVLIFDDYKWQLMPTEVERPKLGVDAFLAAIAGQYRELHRSYQVVIEKIGPWRQAARILVNR
jgi:predicted O-methyltransferase YrrM